MPGELQPLASNFAIVDADGKPNQYFIRWAQQRQIDITAGITLDQAQALIDDWAAARQIIAGAGLTGGGTLAADRTLDVNTGIGLTIATDQVRLADTAVAPAIYGDSTHVPQITIDQQGRIVLAASVAITSSGGGGSIFSTPPTAMASSDTGGNACMGNIVILKDAITVSDLYGSFVNSTIGNIYNMFIATINPATGAIVATVAATPSFTTTATGGQTKKFTFAAPAVLAPGAYLFGIVRTNGTPTSQCNSIYGNSATSYPNLPIDAGEMFRLYTSSVRAATYATNASSPAVVATTGIATTAIYAVGIKFTY